MTTQKLMDAFQKTEKALYTLEEALQLDSALYPAFIDASIQRFEFSIELFWKLLKRIMESLGQETTFPKEVLQKAFAGHLIDHEELWLSMLRDRNLSSHTYDEQLAKAMYERLKLYLPLMKETLSSLQKKFLFPDSSSH